MTGSVSQGLHCAQLGISVPDMTVQQTLTIGSLCSGYGGLDIAVEEFFGAETAWFAEYEAAPSKILAHHWPTVPNLGDMTKIDWASVPKVDIITGGTPCQDLSAAGRRRGMTEGTRSNLWVQMRECIAAVRPSVVVWENVRGALSAYATSDVETEDDADAYLALSGVELGTGLLGEPYGRGRPALRAILRVLGDLADLGFDAEVALVRASDAGAPHQRFRVFVVAYSGRNESERRRVGRDMGGAQAAREGDREERQRIRDSALDRGATAEDTDVAARGERRVAAPGQAEGGRARADARGRGRAPARADEGDVDAGASEDRPREALRELRGTDGAEAVQRPTGGPDSVPVEEELLAGVREQQARGDEGRESLAGASASRGLVRGVRDDVEAACASHRPESGEQRPVEPADAVRLASPEAALAGGPRQAACGCAAWGQYAPAIHRWEGVLGRQAPAPTVPDGKNGSHRLSTLAVEFMMGLPAGHVTDPDIGITRNEQLKALGNGVVPQQAHLALSIAWPRLADVRTEAAA